jgi:hypothetical protein
MNWGFQALAAFGILGLALAATEPASAQKQGGTLRIYHRDSPVRRFDLDPEAQVAVICGNGRAFSSGADVHQRQLRRREEFEQHGGPQGWGAHSGDLLTRSVNWKPVIAAPHGYAMGLALGIGSNVT